MFQLTPVTRKLILQAAFVLGLGVAAGLGESRVEDSHEQQVRSQWVDRHPEGWFFDGAEWYPPEPPQWHNGRGEIAKHGPWAALGSGSGLAILWLTQRLFGK